MAVKTFKPKCTVTLHKRVERRQDANSRVALASRDIDLTPFLGEGSSVNTRKSVRDPAGTFSIVIPDKTATGIGSVSDSLYGFIEPMDFVEIRMARRPADYAGGSLPIVMRGFVNTVRRVETITGDKPGRNVVISGFDYGLVPQIYIIYPYANYLSTPDYLTQVPLHVYGMDARFLSAAEWVGIIVNMLNDWLRRMAKFAGFTAPTGGAGLLPLLALEASVSAAVSPYPMQPWNNSLGSLLRNYCDLAWNELFIEDRAAGPVMVYRPIPFTDLNGNSIQGTPIPVMKDAAGSALVVSDREVVVSDLTRSDSNVANFFLVMPPSVNLLDPRQLLAGALSGQLGFNPFESDYPNNLPEIYGLKPMEVETQQLAPSYTNRALPADARAPANLSFQNDLVEWLGARRQALAKLNHDNSVYENGALLLRGSELFRAGNYFTLQRGKLAGSYYAHCVEHNFRPFDRFTSNLLVERGTGFLERTKQSTSPALMEGRPGVYS